MKRVPLRIGAPWLRRHPHLLAHWLAAHNVAARGGAMNLIEPLLAYWPLVVLLAAVHSLMTVSRRLRRGKLAESKSWLAAAPIRPASPRLTRVHRAG